MVATNQVRLRIAGRLGRITLDRPEAINALTRSMIEAIDSALDRLLADPDVATVVLDGAGERGFCAGGDVVALRESALEGGAAARRLWREEYRLNARIASFAKPVVAAMDGVVMGGGVGLAGHARHRIATERLVWAMPEVRIGFAPDVGGTYLLSRLPGEIGTWIALTARRLSAGEALSLGLIDAVALHGQLDELLERLELENVETALASIPLARDGPGGVADVERRRMDEWFEGDDVNAIARRLEAAGAPARPLLDDLRSASPTSLAVTLAALRQARRLPGLRECLEAEYRTSASLLGVEDFREGIRAALVDRDGRPSWRPDSLAAVEASAVERILAGPPGLGPLFEDGDSKGGGPWTSI